MKYGSGIILLWNPAVRCYLHTGTSQLKGRSLLFHGYSIWNTQGWTDWKKSPSHNELPPTPTHFIFSQMPPHIFLFLVSSLAPLRISYGIAFIHWLEISFENHWTFMNNLRWSYGAYWAILIVLLCGKCTPLGAWNVGNWLQYDKVHALYVK